MELALLVYFANFVETLAGTLWFVLWFLAVWVFVGFMSSEMSVTYKIPTWVCVVGIASVTFLTIIPKEKTVWLMAGAYGAQSVYESQAGQDLKKLVELKIKGIVDAEMEKATKK